MSTENKAKNVEDSRKRHRKQSVDSLSIEEVNPDDMAYDADIDLEVLRPDQYEDPESDFDDDPQNTSKLLNPEDELASRMESLVCKPPADDVQGHSTPGSARKRTSREMEGSDMIRNLKARLTDIEVLDMDSTYAAQPSMKRRKKIKISGTVDTLRRIDDRWTDPSDRNDDKKSPTWSSSDSHTPDDVVATDAMDVN